MAIIKNKTDSYCWQGCKKNEPIRTAERAVNWSITVKPSYCTAAAACTSRNFSRVSDSAIHGSPPGSSVPGFSRQEAAGFGCHDVLQCMRE